MEHNVKTDWDEEADILYIYEERTSGTWVEIEGNDFIHAMIDADSGKFLGITIMNYMSIMKDIFKADEEIKNKMEEGNE